MSVADKNGAEVASLTTPCVANLKRGSGYFTGARYVAKIDHGGWRDSRVCVPVAFAWKIDLVELQTLA